MAQTCSEATTKLYNINQAIDTVLSTGQSYSIAGRRYEAADLSTLETMRKQAELECNRICDADGNTVRGVKLRRGIYMR